MAAFHSQIDDYDTGHLLEAARHVRAMEGTPGWHLVRGLVEVEVERVQTRMISGSLPSYEKLAELRGEMRGLKALLGVCETVLETAQEREREEQALAEASHV